MSLYREIMWFWCNRTYHSATLSSYSSLRSRRRFSRMVSPPSFCSPTINAPAGTLQRHESVSLTPSNHFPRLQNHVLLKKLRHGTINCFIALINCCQQRCSNAAMSPLGRHNVMLLTSGITRELVCVLCKFPCCLRSFKQVRGDDLNELKGSPKCKAVVMVHIWQKKPKNRTARTGVNFLIWYYDKNLKLDERISWYHTYRVILIQKTCQSLLSITCSGPHPPYLLAWCYLERDVPIWLAAWFDFAPSLAVPCRALGMFTYTASSAPGASEHAKAGSASILRESRVPSEVLILITLLDGKDDWKGLSTK